MEFETLADYEQFWADFDASARNRRHHGAVAGAVQEGGNERTLGSCIKGGTQWAEYLISGTQRKVSAKPGGRRHGARQAAVKQLVEGLGADDRGFYFAFGEDDVIIIGNTDIPWNLSRHHILRSPAPYATVLDPPDDLDAANKMLTTYRPPGQ